ncbi:hypothetical protein [Dethiobacter alkaliphilus]|uniref:hypothetical protein n=1 Tax=Dethiobacter alkaliphilus TaxID=427926 RepID=UPI00222704C6|nr:hypothetical protein [Dethiobacter alkaliphilus]MCW3491688.1 hypothetical protein [Dethiobacter alkaliphilus]
MDRFFLIITAIIALTVTGAYFSYKGMVNGYNPLYRYTFWTFLFMFLTFFIGPIANILAIAILVLGCYITFKDSDNKN